MILLGRKFIAKSDHAAMQDAESKIALLTYYAEGVARIACTIPNDYLARVYGRSVFLAVDAFLALAPRLKNEMRRDGRLAQPQADAITERINKLRTDYESYYATVRGKLAAHQQEVDLGLLLEAWNEIDAVTITILSEDMQAVWESLALHGAGSSFARPSELDDANILTRFCSLVPTSGVRLGTDRVAITRPNTTGMIPTGLFQEKATRILTAFEGFQALVNSGLEQITANWLLPEKACVDLFVIDACSIIDNLFEDRAATAHVVAEDSLVKFWKGQNVRGIERLEQFQRDVALERKLRELRNKFCAHVDPEVPLASLEAMLLTFPLQDLNNYLGSIWLAFREVCAQDIRTRPFLLHGQELRGVVAVVKTDAIKPFR